MLLEQQSDTTEEHKPISHCREESIDEWLVVIDMEQAEKEKLLT